MPLRSWQQTRIDSGVCDEIKKKEHRKTLMMTKKSLMQASLAQVAGLYEHLEHLSIEFGDASAFSDLETPSYRR